MSDATIYEIIGYVGSVLVVVSLAMSSIIRLRIVNLAGALVFTLYGALIGSLPVLLTNVVIAGLDVWYLRKELSTRELLTVISVPKDDPFLREFMSFNQSDISKFADAGRITDASGVHLVMLRDASPAGVFIGGEDKHGSLEVLLDYVSPPYRDHKSGHSLYEDDAARFRDLGYTTLIVRDVHDKQLAYFERMGFTPKDDGSMVWNLDGASHGV